MRRAYLLRLCLLASLGGAVGVRPLAAGEEDPPGLPGALGEVSGQVRTWIKQLASDSYAVREEARQGLERLGREVPEVLREFVEDPDPEVRRTVRALLAKLESVAESVPAALADLARIGLVRLDAQGQAPLRVLGDLSTSIGGLLRAPPSLAATPVTLRLGDVPCFVAVEALAAHLGLVAHEPFDPDGCLLLHAPVAGGVAAPSGAAGPVRVRATRVQVSRPLDAVGPSAHALTLEIQLAPCVQLVSYRTPRVIAATDGEARAWRVAGGSSGSTTFGVGGDPRRVEAVLTLEPAVPEAEPQLKQLELGLELRLRHARRELTFETLDQLPRTLDEQGRPSEVGRRGSVTLEAVEAAEGRADAVTVELSCLLTGATARASVEPWIELSDGGRRRLWIVGGRSTTSADGRLRIVGRAHGLNGVTVKGVHVVWFERESAGELAVLLRDVPLR